MSERISSQTRNKNQKQTQSKDKEIKQKATIAEAAQTRAAQHANQEKLVFIGKDNKVINVDANTKILNRVGNKNEFSLVYGRNNNLYYDKPVNLLVDGELVEAKYKGREKISSNTDITTQAAQHANQEGLVFIDKDNKVINVDANTKILMIVGNKHEFSSLYGRDNSFYDKTLSNSKRPPVKLLVNGEFVEARYKGKMAILPQSSNTQESQSNISQQGGITPVVTGVQNQTDQKINIDATNKEDIKPTSQEVLSRENFHLEKFTRPARIFSRVLSVGVEISVPDGYTVSYKNGDYVLSEDKTKETAAQKILSQEKKGYHLENVNGRVVEVENGSVYCYEKTTVRGREIPVKCKIESRKTESPTKVRPQQNIESRKTESSTKVRPQQNVEHEKLLFKDKDNNLIVSNPDTQIEIKYNGRRKFSSLKGVKLQEGDPVTLKIDNKKVIVTYQGKAKENQLYNILGANIEQFREDNTPEENASLTEGIKSGMRQLSSDLDRNIMRHPEMPEETKGQIKNALINNTLTNVEHPVQINITNDPQENGSEVKFIDIRSGIFNRKIMVGKTVSGEHVLLGEHVHVYKDASQNNKLLTAKRPLDDSKNVLVNGEFDITDFGEVISGNLVSESSKDIKLTSQEVQSEQNQINKIEPQSNIKTFTPPTPQQVEGKSETDKMVMGKGVQDNPPLEQNNQLYNILGANIEQFREDNTPEENASLTEGIKSGMRQLSSDLSSDIMRHPEMPEETKGQIKNALINNTLTNVEHPVQINIKNDPQENGSELKFIDIRSGIFNRKIMVGKTVSGEHVLLGEHINVYKDASQNNKLLTAKRPLDDSRNVLVNGEFDIIDYSDKTPIILPPVPPAVKRSE